MRGARRIQYTKGVHNRALSLQRTTISRSGVMHEDRVAVHGHAVILHLELLCPEMEAIIAMEAKIAMEAILEPARTIACVNHC